jgi:hypothetical protein
MRLWFFKESEICVQLKLCPHSLDIVLSFFFGRRIGTPPPLTRRRACPSPHDSRGVHTRLRERGGGRGAVRIPTRGQTMWYSRYICTLCVSLSQWTADKLLWVSFRTYAAASQSASASAKFYKTRRLQWRDSFCRIKNKFARQGRLCSGAGLNARNSFNLYVGDSTVFFRKKPVF